MSGRDTNSKQFVLRDLPLSPRLVIAAFLLSVGMGYFSALVQLHFQLASAGQLLPGPDEAIDAYHGRPGMSQLERLLVADERKPFNGSGSMAAAFTFKSSGWNRAIERQAKKLAPDAAEPDLAAAEESLRKERDGERLALIDWLRHGADRKAYNEDAYPVPASLAGKPITEKYLDFDEDEKPVSIKIQRIISDRCARCHSEGKSGPEAEAALDTYEDIQHYVKLKATSGMSLTALAQTTHVHLLGFSMLFGLTGLAFALTRYPCWLRLAVAPLALVAQVADIACWWLARLDPFFARLILVTGGIVGLSLLTHILGTLWDMFGTRGRIAVACLLVLAAIVGLIVHFQFIAPYLEAERSLGRHVV
jgi:hypothetical protein